tara:strand:+ start:14233 stop:14529 length:297 start_codon:yes stop_codon:yes gene_type:complete
MKLRDWLLARGILQSEFAIVVQITRSHLSSIVTGARKPGKKTAINIEKATKGEVTFDDLFSGKAGGYTGKRKSATAINRLSKYDNEQMTACSQVFSLL